ncbi:MAG: SusC/RagA family TonB-linked outer membrane protein [Chryseobacterium sp. 39-10]|nr:SusC/RagA family TonB-linked outer membrane protein [Chryseobacterium sp.]OJV45966.1 MAG: SusC/RagA family TonB-linked outer membrane protein [Chryseobacterium sp. 39-10]
MKKLTTSVLVVVLTSSFGLVSAQRKGQDSTKTKNIDEVVITGALGIKKVADAVTSAQQVVSATELSQASNPSIVQSLAGKVSGLQINQTNSSVNSENSIQLRGLRSISGKNEALIVIDNVISNSTLLASLPPEIVESVNVIKGAQGAALYGTDGKNGVIIVTTKKGSRNKLSVSYTGSIDFETVAFTPKRQMKYGQGWDKARDQYENGAWGPAFDGTPTLYGLPMYDYDNNGRIDLNGIGWGDDEFSGDNLAAIKGAYSARPNAVEDFFRTGTTYSNGITISAGSEGRYAMLTLNNTNRGFIVDGDDSKRTSVMFKGGAKVNKFSFDVGLIYNRTDYTQTTTLFDETTNDSLYWSLLQSPPDIPITEYKNYPDNAFAWNIYYQNPYWRMKHVRQNYSRNFYNASLGLGYDVNDHINVRYTGNIQSSNSSSLKFRDAFSTGKYGGAAGKSVKAVNSALFLDDRTTFDYYGDLMINFDYDLTSDLNLKVNLGHNYQDHRMHIMQNGGTNLAMPGVYVMTNVTQPLNAGHSSLASNGDYRKDSHALFANLDLSFRDYLFLNLTARNEWQSLLPKNNNSYFYPSIGLSFIPTKAFNIGGSVLNYMKISGNYTKTGGFGPLDWYDINKTAELVSGFPFSGVNSYRNGMVQADENITPEFITTKEINLDLGFFNDRVRIGGSIYEQDTKDMITKQTASSASGINQKFINIAKLTSKGAEVNLGLVPIKTSDFKWELNAGYSYNESIIDEVIPGVTDEVPIFTSTTWGIYAQKGSVFPLIKVSKYQRDDLGRIIIDPATGNPLVTASLENAGSAVPKSIYTFSTSFSYKGFKLGAVADYRYGAKIITDVQSGLAFNGTLWDSGEVDREHGGFIMPNSVIPNGTGGYVENTSIKTGGNTYSSVISWFSSKYATYGENLLVDGQVFKIREIYLNYTLPKQLYKQYGLEEITFGAYARNPFMKLADNNRNYADPESSYYSGTTNNAIGVSSRTQYPSTKVFGASLNIKF